MPVEFDCCDCGYHIVSFNGPSEPPRCYTCTFIAREADPKTRERLRRLLIEDDAVRAAGGPRCGSGGADIFVTGQ